VASLLFSLRACEESTLAFFLIGTEVDSLTDKFLFLLFLEGRSEASFLVSSKFPFDLFEEIFVDFSVDFKPCCIASETSNFDRDRDFRFILPLLFVLKRLLVTIEMFPGSSVVDSTLSFAISTGICIALLNPPQDTYPSVWRVPCEPPRDVFSLLRDHLCGDVCVTSHFQPSRTY